MKIPGIPTERIQQIFSRQTKLSFSQDAFTLKAIANHSSTENRFGIITGKKAIGKQAVVRNRADRRIKAAIGTFYPHMKITGYDFLLFSRPACITVPWKHLIQQIKVSLTQFEVKVKSESRVKRNNRR